MSAELQMPDIPPAPPLGQPVGPAEAIGRYPCGFCRDVYSERHKHCPGATDSGKSLSICPCGCQPLRCIRCHSTEDVDPNRWRCRSQEDCDITQAKRLASNPVIIMIREIEAKSEKRVAAEREARPVRSTPDVPRPAGGRCECGCGAATKSRFAMGHDARLRGQLQRAYAAGDMDAGLELMARGGIWATKAPGSATPPDPDGFVAERVAARLEDGA